ncbi:MAG: hypothetical protein ACI4D5_06345 [Kineothrix sp.]
MIPALNMHLEDVRVVLRNEVNDITVCRDIKETAHRFYTMISIKSDTHRKYLIEQMNRGNLFAQCRDFIGSFSVGRELKLLFHYENDNPIDNVGSIYLYDFVQCRKAAMNLIGTMAEKGVSGQICRLLLNPRNINLNSDCEVTLNYFLDFQDFDLELRDFHDIEYVAGVIFGILERPWKEGLSGNISGYPDELRLFWMKLQNHSFLSYGQIMAQVRSMPDKPMARKGALWRVKRGLRNVRAALFRNTTRIVLTVLVLITILYAGYQIGIRIKAKKAYNKNISYSGLEYIGTVYLGNEE